MKKPNKIKKVEAVVAWAIELDYDGKKEILTGLIYNTKKEALEYYENTELYKPEYKIIKILITPFNSN